MSVFDRLIDGLKSVIALRTEVDEIKSSVRAAQTDVRDHERRLIRLETLVEVAAAQRPRLPRR